MQVLSELVRHAVTFLGIAMFSTESVILQVDLPPATMREGEEYQARIPPRICAHPAGRERDHPRSGMPGPSTLEALAIAAGFEKDASDSLHIWVLDNKRRIRRRLR